MFIFIFNMKHCFSKDAYQHFLLEGIQLQRQETELSGIYVSLVEENVQAFQFGNMLAIKTYKRVVKKSSFL